MLPIQKVKSNVSSIGPLWKRNRETGCSSPSSLWRRANARNVRLYFLYRQYTNLFIFRFVSLLCLRRTLRLFSVYIVHDSMLFVWLFIYYRNAPLTKNAAQANAAVVTSWRIVEASLKRETDAITQCVLFNSWSLAKSRWLSLNIYKYKIFTNVNTTIITETKAGGAPGFIFFPILGRPASVKRRYPWSVYEIDKLSSFKRTVKLLLSFPYLT